MTNLSPIAHSYDPIDAVLSSPDAALAVISGVAGPSYRPVGAVMAVMADGQRIGSLSSGCVEADIAVHAVEALADGQARKVLYGQGSPFRDIELPCGGGLQILIVPRPNAEVLRQVQDARQARQAIGVSIAPETGDIALSDQATGWDAGVFHLHFIPPLQFFVFGKGPEASTFAGLAQASGFPNTLFSPDDETLLNGQALGCGTVSMVRPKWPDIVRADDRTAIVLFFHDHDWEPPLLASALETDAFYIGSQGSLRARDTRFATLREMGVGEADLARLSGPVGLIRSARDPQTLAVSVLAEILAADMGQLP